MVDNLRIAGAEQAAEKLFDWGVNRKTHPPGAKAPTHFIGFAARLEAAP
jgi:hypothetical protein